MDPMTRIAAGIGLVMAAAVAASSQTAPPPSRQAIVDELVVANHILANEGVLDGYGHVSVRSPADPARYLLARAGAPALVTAADITEYDLNSRPVTNTSSAGYQERFIHGEIYKARPDVMAVRALPLSGGHSLCCGVRAAAAPLSHGLLRG